ncbi:CLUMA_CG010391, isoform A [Clunio marinus]|uniref:CLUMA_CG010391, isoform A n=1 Tax=Clunio marinus TaxID=568069 RepID=A0A1J1I9H5_9DIPT|nr:CLUMA_CG010391, isoform A [Clunio marinus]
MNLLDDDTKSLKIKNSFSLFNKQFQVQDSPVEHKHLHSKTTVEKAATIIVLGYLSLKTVQGEIESLIETACTLKSIFLPSLKCDETTFSLRISFSIPEIVHNRVDCGILMFEIFLSFAYYLREDKQKDILEKQERHVMKEPNQFDDIYKSASSYYLETPQSTAISKLFVH